MSYVVEVHGHRDLDEAAQTGATALAGFSHFQVFTKVGREEVTTVRDSVNERSKRECTELNQHHSNTVTRRMHRLEKNHLPEVTDKANGGFCHLQGWTG